MCFGQPVDNEILILLRSEVEKLLEVPFISHCGCKQRHLFSTKLFTQIVQLLFAQIICFAEGLKSSASKTPKNNKATHNFMLIKKIIRPKCILIEGIGLGVVPTLNYNHVTFSERSNRAFLYYTFCSIAMFGFH